MVFLIQHHQFLRRNFFFFFTNGNDITCFSCVPVVLLLIFFCQRKKALEHRSVLQEESIQTLMNYNQEGGLSELKVCRGL